VHPEIGVDGGGDSDVFFTCPYGEYVHRVFYGHPEVKVDDLEIELSRLDFREVQDVVEKGEQGVAACAHDLYVTPLLGIEGRVQK